ncbi:MAG: hypothetical protein LBG52_01120 [Candidatus Peribacteria bacterium]|jgi:hypothetical protein|nr:hypothetical protein [Candidatus Peribacteria bacterium]
MDNNSQPENNASIVSTEMIAAYQWAFQRGITTMPTFSKARLTDPITRAEMAKMISVFATKLLHKSPNNEKAKCTQFIDLSFANDDLQPYIVESCQLGLMGMQGDGVGVQDNFFPH